MKQPSGPAPRPSLQQRKQQLVRDSIWDAATELFAGQGFEATTVDGIAERAGVSRRTFFRYFSSKNDLMAHGAANFGSHLRSVLETLPARLQPGEALRAAVLQVARDSAAHSRTRTIMSIAARYPEARAAQLARMAELQHEVAEAYYARGGANAVEASVLAWMTLTALSVTFHTWAARKPQPVEQVATEVLDALRHSASPAPRRRSAG